MLVLLNTYKYVIALSYLILTILNPDGEGDVVPRPFTTCTFCATAKCLCVLSAGLVSGDKAGQGPVPWGLSFAVGSTSYGETNPKKT